MLDKDKTLFYFYSNRPNVNKNIISLYIVRILYNHSEKYD